MAVGITVGRHVAGDGERVHPLVAAALDARRAPQDGPAPGTHRQLQPAGGPPEGPAGTTPEREGDLGWPGSPGDGTGLGWPGDTDESGQSAPTAAPAPKRLGWRRLFGRAA
jgi:hypothetical protein